MAAAAETQRDLREAILEAAEMQFRTRGYADTSLADIASSVDLTGPALYYYFKSKSDLLYHALREPMQQQIDLCRNAIRGKEPLDQVRAFIYTVVQFVLARPVLRAEHGPAFIDMSVLAQSLPEPEQREILRLERTSAEDLRDVIKRGIKEKAMRSVDPTASAFALLGLAVNVTWFHAGGRLTVDDVASEYAELAVAAVRPD